MKQRRACMFCGWSPDDAETGGDEAPADYAGNERAWLNWLRECCNARSCVLRLGQQTKQARRATGQARRQAVAPVRARFQQDEQRRRAEAQRRRYGKTKGRPV